MPREEDVSLIAFLHQTNIRLTPSRPDPDVDVDVYPQDGNGGVESKSHAHQAQEKGVDEGPSY